MKNGHGSPDEERNSSPLAYEVLGLNLLTYAITILTDKNYLSLLMLPDPLFEEDPCSSPGMRWEEPMRNDWKHTLQARQKETMRKATPQIIKG